MSLRLGDVAPNFKAKTTEGEIDFYEYLGNSWGILFSHPADFTPVCTTELGKTALLQEEFAKRNVKVLAVSVDPLDKHFEWRKDINETQKRKIELLYSSPVCRPKLVHPARVCQLRTEDLTFRKTENSGCRDMFTFTNS